MTTSYQPQPGSVAFRVLQHFAANPMAEMTTAQLASMTESNSANMKNYLAASLKHGLVTSDAGVWRRGDGSIQLTIAAFPQWLAGKGQKSHEGLPPPAALPSPEQLVIKDGIEIPPDGPKGTYARYAPVFQRMAVKQCIDDLDEASAKGLIKIARRFGKTCERTYITRPLNDDSGKHGIWRTE